MQTSDLALVLQSELWEAPRRTRWPEVALLLSDRALDGDRRAMEGMLAAALDLPNMAVEREYRTYMANLFTRGGTRTVSLTLAESPAVELVPFESVNEPVTDEIRAFRARWLGSRVDGR